MRVAPAQADRFCRTPDPAVRVVLVYGPDAGQVEERIDQLTRSVVSDPADPFLVADLSADVLTADPARLADEAAAIAMTGGRRVVRLRGVEADAGGFFAGFLKDVPGDALILLGAGELKRTSALVKTFEGAGNAAALACFADNAARVETLARSILREHGVTIEEEALAYLSVRLGSDRTLTRREIEKLALYAGPGGRLDAAEVMQMVGDSVEHALEELAFAAADGDVPAVSRIFDSALAQGASTVGMLRAVGGHFMRLHEAAHRIRRGQPAKAAMEALRPPVFYMLQDRFAAQAQAWPADALSTVVLLIADAEADQKRSGHPEASACGRALYQIAQMARRQRSRRPAARARY